MEQKLINHISKTIKPPYSTSDLAQILGVLLILILIPITVSIAQKSSSELSNKKVIAAPAIEIGVDAYTENIASEPKGLTYVYKYVVGQGWQSYVTSYIQNAYANNLKPVVVFYTNFDSTTPDFVAWDQVMGAVKADGREVWVVVEPDMWGYIKNNNQCGSVGKSDVDRFLSTKASNAHLGFFISPWNLPYVGATQDASDWQACWLAAGGNRMEDVYVDVSDRDQEFKGDYPWPASKITMFEDWFKALNYLTGKKISVWQIPMGNTTCNNSRRSNLVETWLASAKLSALSPYVSRMLFGPGIETGGSAQSWNLSGDDVYDCGLFNQRIADLYGSPPAGDTQAPTTPTNLASTTISSSQINLSWSASTDNVAVTGYDVYRNDAQITTVATTSYSNTGLLATTNYCFYVRAKDAAGNVSPASNTACATTASVSDTQPPAVSITAPVSGATVSGMVNITANATDNVGVTKVEFYVDGVLKSTDTASPYAFSWDSKTVANGSHTLSAKAYDAAGNVGTSAVFTVTVSNTTPPPTSVSLEAELMSLPAGYGQVFTDSKASGGKALLIWSNATATGQVSGAAKTIVVSAKGDQCRGAPHMVVRVDGVKVLDTLVSLTAWSNYSASTAIASGAHTVTVTFDNDYYKKCDRNLRVDKITFAN